VPRARRRRGRRLLIPFAVLLASQVVFGAALSWVLPVWAAALVALVGYALLVRVTLKIWADPPRPVWRIRLFDEPLFLHFGASMGALLIMPVGLLVAFLGAALGSSAFDVRIVSLGGYGIGFLFSAYALWIERRRVQVRELEVTIEGLPGAFDGYRIVQLTDLHIGSFDRLSRGLAWAKLANATQPDLALCTGDLVTSGPFYYEDAAKVLGALRAADGTITVLGNHDQWEPERLVRLLEAEGVRVLRNQWVTVERDGAAIVVAGLDDHRFTQRDDLGLALRGRPEGVTTILLSHYPTFFNAAAERGVDLVLSGHTHNGQVGLPFVGDRWNFARLTGQATRGLFTKNKTKLYVSAGLGTSGPPLRLGALPEIAVLTLRRRAPEAVPG
jgi:predicted MPP superfamily phosphohydrolase